MNYSQNNEQEVILHHFKDRVTGDQPLTFLDLGANDGKTLSNTYALMEQGWGGVYVEASPRAYLKLKGTVPERKGLYFYNCAIGTHNGRAKFYESGEHITANDVGLISTLVPSEIQRWKGSKFDNFTETEVDCYRWLTFLNRLMLKKFDFVSIDIEGMDLEVLKQMDLSETSMVCVEFNGKDKESFIAAAPGFHLIHTTPENLIFAR